jgi:acetyl esterase/lipase
MIMSVKIREIRETIEDIVVAEIDGGKILLDLILPEIDKTGKPAPVIINLHGGGWCGGDHKAHRFLNDYIMRGWAMADVGYRLSRAAPFPAQIEDCHTAVRFLRANAEKYNLDPNRIGVFGFSAGGHLAALLGATADVVKFHGLEKGGWEGFSSEVQAVVTGNGPMDIFNIFSLIRSYENSLRGALRESGKFTEEQIQAACYCAFGDAYRCYTWLLGGKDPKDDKQAKELCDSASVMQYVNKNTPPFYVIQSDADDSVSVSHAYKIYLAMKEAGADIELKIVPNANHGLCNDMDGNYDFSPVNRMFGFFAEKLKIEGYDPADYPVKDNNA